MQAAVAGIRRAGSPRIPRFAVAAVLAIALLLAAVPATASVRLEVRVEGGGDGAEITLVAADGTVRRAVDRDGDAYLVLLPAGSAGTYELAVEVGGERALYSLAVPESGAVRVVYHALDKSFEVEVEGRDAFESEIAVTARKREENVQEIPIAITAFSDVALEARSMRDLTNVAEFTPNLDFSVSGGVGGSPSEATIYLRGVGQIETGIMADPGVGIYVDGVYIARSQGAVFELLDLERVEVLRGPQGTIFGKNTTGGAIHLVTRKPSRDFGGYLSGTIGNLSRRDVAFRLNGSLSENVFGSIVGQIVRRDGFVTSLESGRRLNDDNRESLRGALRFLPAENLVVDWTLDVMRERETALDQNLIAIIGSPLLAFYNTVRADNGFPVIDESFITGDLRRSWSDGPSLNDGDVVLSTLRLAYTGRRFNLLSISAYRDYEFVGANDFDGTPLRFFERSYLQTQDQLSQELQLSGQAREGRLRWLAGALYFEENPVDDATSTSFEGIFELLESAPGPIYAFPTNPPSTCLPEPLEGSVCLGGAGNPGNLFFLSREGQINVLAIETTSAAVFGELTWELGERLSLTAGVRYTYEEKETRFTAYTPPAAPPPPLREKRDWDAISPRLSLSATLGDGVMWYVSASRGFKSGGLNAARSFLQDQLIPFDQEKLWAFETGLKSDLWENRLRLNVAAFHYEYDDVQFGAFVSVGQDPLFTISNAADAQIQGLEAELEVHPSRGLLISGTFGWIDSEYTELRLVGGAPTGGVFPKTPDWQMSLSAQYAFEAGEAGSFILRGDYSYRDDFFHDVANAELLRQDAYGLLNGRVVYALPSDRLEVALFGTNLGDEEYFEHGFFASGAGEVTAIAGRPREWGLSLELRF